MNENSGKRPAWCNRHVEVCVTAYLTIAGGIMLMTAIWAWNIAERAAEGAVQPVHWLGPDFTASPATAALVLAAVSAAAASFIHSTAQFAPHKRHRRPDHADLAWYLLRPLNAALLGMVTVVLIRSGMISIGTTGEPSTAAAGFEAGAIAGLCTDRLLTLIDRLTPFGTAGQDAAGRDAAAGKPAKSKKAANAAKKRSPDKPGDDGTATDIRTASARQLPGPDQPPDASRQPAA